MSKVVTISEGRMTLAEKKAAMAKDANHLTLARDFNWAFIPATDTNFVTRMRTTQQLRIVLHRLKQEQVRYGECKGRIAAIERELRKRLKGDDGL